MTTQQIARLNGISLDQVQGLVGAMREHPEAATVRARTHHRWDNAFAVDGRVEEFEQAGEVFVRTHHTFRTDWPQPFGGDSGPTPGLESVLGALGACVATTYALKAATSGVDIEDLEVMVEGKVDLRGLFELDSVPARFSSIVVQVRVRSDEDEAVIEELGHASSRSSPVFDSLANPVSLQLSVERME